MASLSQFAKRMGDRARLVVVDSNKAAIQLGTLIVNTVVMATPVDTGHARANWQVGISQEKTDEVEFTDVNIADEGHSAHSTGVTGQATIDEAVRVLNTKAPGQTIHITNNVPYIKRLNEGWSAQAPAGFVQKAVNASIAAWNALGRRK